MEQGKLQAIWVKRMRRGPMDPAPSATLVAGRGIVGNANQGGKRQVTIIEQEVWEELMNEVGGSIPPSARRANLMVSGIRLKNSLGKILRVGTCRIRIHGETKPCERMEEAQRGLRAAMQTDWRGGAYGEPIDDREISVGDPVTWEE